MRRHRLDPIELTPGQKIYCAFLDILFWSMLLGGVVFFGWLLSVYL